MKDACPHCAAAARLQRDARLVHDELERLRAGLVLEPELDERLELVAAEHELELLLERIVERQQAVTL
jgi:hypothetical protein